MATKIFCDLCYKEVQMGDVHTIIIPAFDDSSSLIRFEEDKIMGQMKKLIIKEQEICRECVDKLIDWWEKQRK